MKSMIWVVNPTKLCNLRCSYCYEWNSLSDPTRMDEDLLRRVLVAVRDYHWQLEATYPDVMTNISWLGGEPLALPVAYLKRIMLLQEEIFNAGNRGAPRIRNVVQTNLYKLTDSVIDFLSAYRWTVGISLDVVPGVRVSVTGKLTERRVEENVERLRARNIFPEAIVVLARHTTERIAEVYDYFAARNYARIRVLPLFSGPPERPMDNILAPNTVLAESLCRLWVHWLATGCKVQVEPLELYMLNVLRKMLGIRGRLYDRRRDGECVTIVNTNGDVYQLLDAYEPAMAMGNLRSQAVDAVLSSDVAMRTLLRDDMLRAEMCVPCQYANFCSGVPAFESPREGNDFGRCPVAYRVHEFMEQYLRDSGLDASDMESMLQDIVRTRAGGAAAPSERGRATMDAGAPG